MRKIVKIICLIKLVLLPAFAAAGGRSDLNPEKKWQVKTTPHFIIKHKDGKFAEETSTILEKLYDDYFEFFSETGFDLNKPERKLKWLIFENRKDFIEYSTLNDFMDMSYVDGYYSPLTNRIAIKKPEKGFEKLNNNSVNNFGFSRVNPSIEFADRDPYSGVIKIAHETAHQLAFNTGLQNKKTMYPFWVSEGFAMNFENMIFVPSDFAGNNEYRKKYLIKAVKEGKNFALEDLLVITRVPCLTASEVNVLYAQSWGFFNFIYKTQSEELKKYLNFLSRNPDLSAEKDLILQDFERFFGDIRNLEKSWERYLNNLISS